MRSITIVNQKSTIIKEVKKMAHRESMKQSKDKKVYTQTASKVKKINVKPKTQRGGIRL